MRAAGGSPFQPPEGVPGLPAPLQREMTDFYHLDEPWFVEFGFVRQERRHAPVRAQPRRSLPLGRRRRRRRAFPVTGRLILLAAAWAIPVGILLGLFAAVRRSSALDHLATSAASVLLGRAGLLRHLRPLALPRVRVGRVPARLGDAAGQGPAGASRSGLAPAGYVGPPDARRRRGHAPVRLRPHRTGEGPPPVARHRRARAPQLVRAAALGDAADARAPRHRRVLRRDGLQRSPASRPSSSRPRAPRTTR